MVFFKNFVLPQKIIDHGGFHFFENFLEFLKEEETPQLLKILKTSENSNGIIIIK